MLSKLTSLLNIQQSSYADNKLGMYPQDDSGGGGGGVLTYMSYMGRSRGLAPPPFLKPISSTIGYGFLTLWATALLGGYYMYVDIV